MIIENNIITHFENNQTINACPECHNGIITDTHRGDTLCDSCGLILSEKTINIKQGEINYIQDHNKEKPYRHFYNPILKFYRQHTIIPLKKETKPLYKRIAKINRSFLNTKEATLRRNFSLIDLSVNLMQLPKKIKFITMHLFVKCINKNITRGRSIDGFIAAMIYYACRNENIPITLPDLSQTLDISTKTIIHHLRVFITKLNLKLTPINPILYIPKFCKQLQLNKQIESQIIILLQKIPMKYFLGRNTRSCLSALFYYVCKINNLKKTQKEICEIMQITEVSLRSRYQELISYYGNPI